MPRRLDPKKGLPGLFAPGRPKAQEMAFLVEAPRAPVSAVETPPVPTPRKRKAKARDAEPAPEPSAVQSQVQAPVPDYILLAPPFRAVPVALPEPERLRLAEIPALVGCAVGWLATLVARRP